MLTEEQKTVVDKFDGVCRKGSSILVASIAGSGKTSTIVNSVKKLISTHNVKPNQIMLITYTSTAAEHIKEVLKINFPWCSTFHAISKKILGRYDGRTKLQKTTQDKARENLNNPDDDLTNCIDLLKKNTKDIIRFKKSIKYVFVDELQDVNTLMVSFLYELFPQSMITAVGDDNQSLFEFQGGKLAYIRNFSKMFAPCIELSLTKNFRCSKPILDLANAVMNAGDRDQYLPKQMGTSAQIQNQGEEKYWSLKPRLRECTGPADGIKKTCLDIESRLKNLNITTNAIRIEPHEICILAKTNKELNLARSFLAEIGIPSVVLKKVSHQVKEQTSKLRQATRNLPPEILSTIKFPSLETKVKGKVILATIHSSKGLEWNHGYICTLMDKKWPSATEPDLEKERRLLYVAITRFAKTLSLYHVSFAPSLFIRELSDLGTLSSLVESAYTRFPKENSKELFESKSNIITDLSQSSQSDLFILIRKWISNLNGCSFRHCKLNLLPNPIDVTIEYAPIYYSITNQHIRPSQATIATSATTIDLKNNNEIDDDVFDDQEMSDITDTDDENQSSNEEYESEEFENENGDDDYEEDRDAIEEEEKLEPHHHTEFVIEHSVEEEFENFLNCFIDRWLQEMTLKFENIKIPKYSYPPATTKLHTNSNNTNNKRNIIQPNISDEHVYKLTNYYNQFQKTSNCSKNLLMSIFWTSIYEAFQHNNTKMLHVNLEKTEVDNYSFIIDEIMSTLHYLIYSWTDDKIYNTSNQNPLASNNRRWTYFNFYNDVYQQAQPCILIGQDRLLMWTTESAESSENGSLEFVYKAMAYAATFAVTSPKSACKPIVLIHIYQIFTRKIIHVNINEWSLQKRPEFLKYLQSCRKDVYEGYEINMNN